MTDTSLIFNILAKDKASQMFNQLRMNATHAFDMISHHAFNFAKDSIAAFEEAERGQLLLTDAFAKFPAIGDTNIQKLRELDTALQKTTKFDDDAVAAGQAKLAMFKFTGAQIEALTPLMLDFAAKTGGDLNSAAMAFGKAMVGQGRGLKQVGINFKDTGTMAGNFAELQQQLSEKVGGFAAKEGKTAAGQTAILKNQYGELQEKIGGGLVPVLLKMIPPIIKILDYLQRNSKTVIKVVAVLGTLIGIIWLINAAVRAYTAVQIALNIAMSLNPVGLIIIAIIALIAIIVILWMKSSAFRNFFIGMWAKIWHDLKMIGSWFAGPFKDFFVNAFNFIVGNFKKGIAVIVDKFNGVVNFLEGIGARIRKTAVGMWDGLVSSFKGAINLLISLWNRLDFGINIRVPDWIPGVGGKGFSVPDLFPDIPLLDTGGRITNTGMAIVHAGEIVTPARAVQQGGGQVTIRFAGNTDSAFAVAFQKALNSGLITIDSKWVR